MMVLVFFHFIQKIGNYNQKNFNFLLKKKKIEYLLIKHYFPIINRNMVATAYLSWGKPLKYLVALIKKITIKKISFFLDSFLENNLAIYDEKEYYLHSNGGGEMAYVHFQMAGAIKSQVETLIVSECYFRNNSNFKGGGIYINKNNNYDWQYVYINNSIFSFNEAGDSGASLQFENNIQKIRGNVTNCFFQENFAWCK